MSDEPNPLGAFLNLASEVREFMDEHGDDLTSMFAGYDVDVEGPGEIQVHEDEVVGIMHNASPSDNEVEVDTYRSGGKLKLRILHRGSEIQEIVPGDILIDKAEAEIRNGILVVEIPRDNEDDVEDIIVETVDIDEEGDDKQDEQEEEMEAEE